MVIYAEIRVDLGYYVTANVVPVTLLRQPIVQTQHRRELTRTFRPWSVVWYALLPAPGTLVACWVAAPGWGVGANGPMKPDAALLGTPRAPQKSAPPVLHSGCIGLHSVRFPLLGAEKRKNEEKLARAKTLKCTTIQDQKFFLHFVTGGLYSVF